MLEAVHVQTVVLGEMLTKAEPGLIKWWIDTRVKRGLIKRSFDPEEMLHETVR